MVKKFLWLALFIMNRLNYPTKFALISILFLCPIALLSVGLWNQLEKDIQTTADERQGIQIIRKLSALQVEADKARLTLMLNDAYPNDEIKQLNNGQKTRVSNSLQALREYVEESDQQLLTEPMLQRLEATWQNIADKRLGAQYVLIREYFDVYGSLSAEIEFTINKIAKTSGLATDFTPAVESRYTLLVDTVYSQADIFKKLHTYGLYGLNAAYLDTQVFDIVDAAFSTSTGSQEAIKSRFSGFIEAQAPSEKLSRLLHEGLQEIDSLIQTYDNQLITGYGERLTWQQFNSKAQALDTVLREIEAQILTDIEQVIQVRLDEKEQNRIMLVVSLCALLAIIAYLYFGLYYSMKTSVNQLVEGARLMADGDMRVNVAVQSRDEVAELVKNFNLMSDHIRSLIKIVTENTESTAKNATHVQSLANTSSQFIRDQLQETNKISVAMEQMAASAEEVSKEAELTAAAAGEADDVAREGQVLVTNALASFDQLTQSMNESKNVVADLAEQSRGATTILEAIKGIAAQTNLLALNAAIEASRAGDQGRGFAVVADEVRTLAQRSHEATLEIDNILGSIQAGVNEAVNSMDASVAVTNSSVETARSLGQQLEEILNKVTMISGRTQSISATTSEQSQAVIHVKESIRSIDDKASESANSADNTVASTKQMNDAVEHLKEQLKRFQV